MKDIRIEDTDNNLSLEVKNNIWSLFGSKVIRFYLSGGRSNKALFPCGFYKIRSNQIAQLNKVLMEDSRVDKLGERHYRGTRTILLNYFYSIVSSADLIKEI